MPDPDVPPLNLSKEFVDDIKKQMPLLPQDYRAIFRTAEVPDSIIEIILNHQALAKRLEQVSRNNTEKITQKVANLFVGTILSEENAGLDLSLGKAESLAELATMNDTGELSSTATKQVLIELYDPKNAAKSAKTLAKEMNLLQENDSGALEAIIDQVIADPAAVSAVQDVRSGEQKAIGFLIGLVMKHSGGKANPAKARELIIKKLS